VNNTAFVVGVDDFHGVTSAENGVVFHDFVGDTLGNVFSGDFFDAQFTCGDDDADAAGFVLVNDSCHGMASAEDGDGCMNSVKITCCTQWRDNSYSRGTWRRCFTNK